MYNYELKFRKTFDVQIQSNIQRKIKLIKYLSNENRWYTLEEIATVVNASTKTISKDLGIIKESMPKTWDIHIQKGFGVKLLIPTNESIEVILCALFRRSLTFQVLNKLLKNGETTVANLAEELHIQPYAVTKVLKKVEKDLMHYNLKLHRKPLKIIGQESKIIFMFSELYFKAYLTSDWPFQYNQDDILDLISNIENTDNLVLLLNSRRLFSYYIAILLLRKKQNYTIQEIENVFYLNEGTRYFDNISRQLDTFSKKNGIHFSKSEKIILTTIFKCSNYIYKQPSKEKEIDIGIFKEHNIAIYELVNDFINELYTKFGYTFIKEDEFICSMIAHFRKRIYTLHFYPYVKYIEPFSLNDMKKKYLKNFLKVKEIYKKWIKKHNIANSISEEEILSIVIYIEAALINDNLKAKNILVIAKEDDYWKKYIEAILKDKFGNKVNFISIFSENLSKGLDILEPEYDVDLILSTMPLHINSHPVIQIQPYVSERDLNNINNFLNGSNAPIV